MQMRCARWLGGWEALVLPMSMACGQPTDTTRASATLATGVRSNAESESRHRQGRRAQTYVLASAGILNSQVVTPLGAKHSRCIASLNR